jgi:hypothetical protein
MHAAFGKSHHLNVPFITPFIVDVGPENKKAQIKRTPAH